jgi:hypothetical protein
MPINVNCTSFRQGGDCLHQAAPRRWFGLARCIVWLDEMGANTDPRQVRVKCALCTPQVNPMTLRPVVPQTGWSTVEGVPQGPAAAAHPPVKLNVGAKRRPR